MRIDRVETFILKAPLGEERFYYSQRLCGARESLLVKVTTDSGTVGWGEGGVSMPVEHAASALHSLIAPRVLGADPLATDPVWHDVYAFTRDFGRRSTPIDALSALDIALWDIRGKEAGKPISALLGGAFRHSVRAYATGFYYHERDVADIDHAVAHVCEEAQQHLDAGFTAMKGKIGLLPVADDVRRMEALRGHVGRDVLLMADANHAYNCHTAVSAGRALEGLDYAWFEEPVVPEDVPGCAALRAKLSIPIATGETEYTRFGFLELLRHDAADILQPDLARCGGISEARRIQALAGAFCTPVIPHVWGSGVAMAAALQFLATLEPTPHTVFPHAPENEPMLEFDRSANPLREELLAEPFTLDGDDVSIPQSPGLGIEVAEDALHHYCVAHRESRP